MSLAHDPSPVPASSRPARRRPLRQLIGRTIALGLLKGMATAAGSLIVSSIVWWVGQR